MTKKYIRKWNYIKGILGILIFLSSSRYVQAESIEPNFYNIFDNHGSSMLLVDPSTGEIVYANQASAEFYGYSMEELTKMNIANLNVLSSVEIANEMQLAIKQKRNFFEFKHKLASGEIRNVEVYSYPYKIGTKEMLFSIIHDVTIRVRLETINKKITSILIISIGIALFITLIFLVLFFKKNKRLVYLTKMLRNSNELITNFINADNRLIYLKDENFKYVFINKSLEKFYNLDSNDILGKDDYEISEGSFATQKRQTDEAVLKKNDNSIAEVNWNGRIYKTNKFPIKLLNDKYGVGAIIEDITDEIKHVREVEQILLRNTIMVDVFHRDFLNLDDHMNYVLQQLLMLTESLYGIIYFCNYDRKEVSLAATCLNGITDSLKDINYLKNFIENTEILQKVIMNKKSIVNNETDIIYDQAEESRDCIKLHRMIIVPIMIDSQIVSIVCLSNKNIDYSETDIQQISAFMTGIWSNVERRKQKVILEETNIEIMQKKNELQILLDSTAEGIYGIDLNGFCTFINQSGIRLLDYESQDEIVGENIHIKIHHHYLNGQLSPVDDCNILNSIKLGKGIHVESEIFWKKDGSYFDVEYNAYPQYKNGEIIGGVVTFIDNSLKKKMEKLLYAEKEQFRTTLLSVGDAVISTDNNGKIKVMNSVAEKMTGWKQRDAINQPFECIFNIMNEFSGEQCENPVKKVLDTGEIYELANHTILIAKNGHEIPIEDSAAPIKDEDGNIKGVVIVFRDFTEKKEKIEQIEYLSFHDHSTGLYNRRYIEDAISKIDIERNMPLAVFIVDINGLKLTNDAFGHKAGDQLIYCVTELLKELCTVNDVIGRMGGDEFIILMPNTNNAKACSIKNRISEMASKKKIDSIIVSLAVGYAIKEDKGKDIDEILTLADNNMYKDKIKYGKLMRSQTIETVLKNINLKYDQEQIHTERVSGYCEHIARALQMDDKSIQEVKTAGVLHDIGKVMISPILLNKTEKLTDEEFEIIKRHTETSYQILKSVDEYASLAEAVLYHHERYDGKGYPEGLVGEKIPLYARIISVADSYEAMTANRSYQKTKTKEEAIEELINNAGTQFDPHIVDVFVHNVL
ncbi:MAG: diguanylate cyclase and metal dependent phosphohydrolase [Anaerocolumna sp.]|jgi:diguanylate cyclase (GGDEF)-like protein/PAS domain S-box-containing protein|nr:diguanylate cyclase and metal dependent phosphohydrolase [Anaerocolumna sp.]